MTTQELGRVSRWESIREILEGGAVRGQAEVLEKLRQMGHEVTLSSVSRDLKALGAARVGGRYVLGLPAVPTTIDADSGPEAPSVLSSRPAGPNLLVVKTAVGSASAVALWIDRQGWEELIGTVAGDDTIFLATGTRRGQTRVMERLTALHRGDGTHA